MNLNAPSIRSNRNDEERREVAMKVHFLWFAGFLIALGKLVLLFRSYEDRHRFVLLTVPADSMSGALMWDAKLHRACLAIVGDTTADNQTMTFCR
jgi:hypothetical protein